MHLAERNFNSTIVQLIGQEYDGYNPELDNFNSTIVQLIDYVQRPKLRRSVNFNSTIVQLIATLLIDDVYEDAISILL